MSETLPCLVCGASQPIECLRPRGIWQWQEVSYGLNRCSACGSAFSEPLPAPAVLADYYCRHFDYRWYRDHYEAKLRDARQRVAEYLPHLAGRRILDYGGGLGYLARALCETGRESVTFDPYAAANPPDGQWDAVISLHALEHGRDPGMVIEDMKRFLRPGGQLLLAVPNFEGIGYRQRGMSWVWAQPPIVHVFHFTAHGLIRLLERHGFAVGWTGYAERWDANFFADVITSRRTGWFDQAWGIQPLNRWGAYRRCIARFNTWRRFRALAKAMRHPGVDRDLSELQILATLKD